MDRLIKIDATVVSHTGMDYSGNEDNFFINGRYMYEYERDNIQVSVDTQAEEYILAVSDGMDRVSSEKGTSISMMKEMKKFQAKVQGTGGDLVSKLVQMKEKVEEINNIIYSMDIGSQQTKEKDTGFAAVFILDGKFAALSSGKCKAYLLRDGNIKLMTGESKKAERLLKMGIISKEQAKALSSQVALGNGDGKAELHKSDIMDIQKGDVFLICTDGICNALDEEKIHEILAMDKDTGYMANLLVKEAYKKGEKENITALVARAGSSDTSYGSADSVVKRTSRKRYVNEKNEKSESTRTIVAAVIACIVVIGVLSAVFYKSWMPEKGQDDINVTGNNITAEENTAALPDEGLKQEATNGESSGNEQGGTDTQVDEAEGQAEEANNEVANEEKPPENEEGTAETKHIVESGDSLQKISKKYYGTMTKYEIIMKRNNITNPNQLKIGQELIIPKE